MTTFVEASCTRCGVFLRVASVANRRVLHCLVCRKIANREYKKVWKSRNKAKTLADARAYKARHREKIRQSFKDWYLKNPDYHNQRRRTDPQFRLGHYLRTRIYLALKGKNKTDRTQGLLGGTLPEVKVHLEAQFRPGMTWENYGPVWHVDHIKPCVKFDLTQPEQQRKCFNFSNLQPLFALENLQKGGR